MDYKIGVVYDGKHGHREYSVLIDEETYQAWSALGNPAIFADHQADGTPRGFKLYYQNKITSLHKFVMDVHNVACPPGMDRVDHWKRDVTLNRRQDLKWANAKTNGAGARRPEPRWNKQVKTWQVALTVLPGQEQAIQEFAEKNGGAVYTSVRYVVFRADKYEASRLLELAYPIAQKGFTSDDRQS
jgi:hypothetical protein